MTKVLRENFRGFCSVTGLYTCIHVIVLTLLYLYGVVFVYISPAELLMGRKLRTDIPIAKTLLTPQWSYLPEF